MTLWGVVPAAGVGSRMAAERPKQYLPLVGSTVLEQALSHLRAHPDIVEVVVALRAGDPFWPRLPCASWPTVRIVDGGAERVHSVLNALGVLARADEWDWVLVHDAARPCLPRADLDRLIEQVTAGGGAGGLLAAPIHDTVKRADAAGVVLETVPREGLWRAFTPQMFRLGPLRRALEQALASGDLATDEARAMEQAGYHPLLVEGSEANLKVTRPGDLELAAWYLAHENQ